MNSDNELHDLRFEGYTNDQLAQQIDGLRGGAGPQSLRDASESLITLAGELASTDKVLREQLQAIGVSWEGQAAEGGTKATQDAAIYADQAVTPVGDSAAGVATQSGEFSHTRNSAPDSGSLRGPTELSGFDRFAGAFGHTTDNAQRVKETNAARDAAVAGMNGYQNGSADALGRAQTLPVPPGINLVARPVDTGTHVSSVGDFGGGSGTGPRGGPGIPGGSTGPGVPGGGPGTGPGPFTGPPGTPGVPLPPGAPGPNTGVGPMNPFGPAPTGQPLPQGGPRPLPSMFVAEAAAIANAGAAGAALGSSAEKDKVVRGRPGAPGTPGAPPQEGKAPAKGAQPLAAPPDDEARAARNAERFGAKPGKPAGAPIMSPAAGVAPGEEDKTHVRKYGVDAEDVFGDERMTAPPLIGEQEADEQKAD